MQIRAIKSILAIGIITIAGLIIIGGAEQIAPSDKTGMMNRSYPMMDAPAPLSEPSVATSHEPSHATYDLKMMESLDNDLWPNQRRKMRKSYVEEMLERVHSFSPAHAKRQQIEKISKRVDTLERKTSGKR